MRLGIVEQNPTVVIDSYPLPMPPVPAPPPEGYGQVSCLDHPEVENCYWEQGGTTWGPVQGPVPMPPTPAPAPQPGALQQVFGSLSDLPPTLLVGALIFFLLVVAGKQPTRGKTARSLVA